jgi:hypothetical protein
MTPDLHGISRMTNVICPVAQMGRLTAELAEAERLRGRPWLVAAKWGAEHLAPSQGGQAAKSTIAAAPTFLAAAAAVLLVIGAASGLSPIGSDRADEAFAAVAAPDGHRRGPRFNHITVAPPAVLHKEAVTEGGGADAKGSEVHRPVSVPVTETRSSVAEVLAPTGTAIVADGCAASGTCSRLPAKAVEDAALPLEAISARFAYVGDAGVQSLVSVAESPTEGLHVTSLYTAVVKGLPFGTQLSKGTPVGKGEWIVALDDLGTVEIAIPASAPHPVHARVEVSTQNGSPVVRFPVIVDAKGRIEAKPIVTAAMAKAPVGVAGPTRPVRADKPLREKSAKPQKEAAMVPQQPKRKAASAVIKTAGSASSAPKVAVEAVQPVSDVSPVGTMPEGSAGLETFRTFSLLGANP